MLATITLLIPLLSHIPDIIKLVETLQGPGNGQAKLQSAIQLLLALEPDLERAIGVSPALHATIEKIISIIVSIMNANGTMPTPAPAVTPNQPQSGA